MLTVDQQVVGQGTPLGEQAEQIVSGIFFEQPGGLLRTVEDVNQDQVVILITMFD